MRLKTNKRNGRKPSSLPTKALFCLAALLLTCRSASAAFGITSSGGYYTVNNGANLVFMINQSDGDMTSCKYKGTEYQCQSDFSHVESGLGSGASITAATNNGDLVITEHASNWYGTGNIYHYMVVESGVDTIFMATYVDSNGGGELRWFANMVYPVTTMPPGMAERDQTGCTLIEASDTFVIPSGSNKGQTRSKYMGSQMAKDLTVLGAPGSGVGVYIAFGNRESSAGGPFFRDIQECSESATLGGSGITNVIYNYLWSAHNQTESQRLNVLYGPYAMIFTTGGTPSVPDMSFMYNFGFHGSVNAAGRGQVVLNGLSGMNTVYTYYMGLANSTAQYWTALSSSGSGECTSVKPGTYTLSIYKSQLVVDVISNVTVTAGSATTLNTQTISGDPSSISTIWRIGDWDGTPLEFDWGVQQTDGFPDLNVMHPSDVRESWPVTTFTVGSSSTSTFPSVQFRGTNSPTTIKFNLTSSQAASAHTMKIGITCAYNSGRPSVTINGHALSNPGASSQPNSRSITIGTYRGNNTTFSWNIPASDFITGQNTMVITPISGSGDLSPWLSASWSYDCVELDN